MTSFDSTEPSPDGRVATSPSSPWPAALLTVKFQNPDVTANGGPEAALPVTGCPMEESILKSPPEVEPPPPPTTALAMTKSPPDCVSIDAGRIRIINPAINLILL